MQRFRRGLARPTERDLGNADRNLVASISFALFVCSLSSDGNWSKLDNIRYLLTRENGIIKNDPNTREKVGIHTRTHKQSNLVLQGTLSRLH